MKALIASEETVSLADGTTGIRLCQVEQDQNIFAVSSALFWTDCQDDVTPETHYWNGSDIILKPQEAILETPPA
jgi:hypothetical protein